MPQTTPLPTQTPALTDTVLARVRAAAHRYVLAGGSLLPHVHDDDRDQHISNVDTVLHPRRHADTFAALLKAHVTEYATHEAIYTSAWATVSDRTDAAFLFGAMVGLELAALMSGLTPVEPVSRPRKDGAR